MSELYSPSGNVSAANNIRRATVTEAGTGTHGQEFMRDNVTQVSDRIRYLRDDGQYRPPFEIALNTKAEGFTGDSVADDYAKFNTLVNTTLQPNGGEVDVIGIPRIASNLTIPANVQLKFRNGAYLAPDLGSTVTILGPITASRNLKIFGGGGAISFLNGEVDRAYPEWFGAKADGSTQDGPAIASAAQSLGPGGTLEFRPKTYKTTKFTISADYFTIVLPRGAVLSCPILGSGNSAITVAANYFEGRGRGKLQGPLGGVYVQDERGISMVGASSASRKVGLKIDGWEITQFGAHAIYAQFVDEIRIPEAYAHNCGYAGAMFLSCDNGRVWQGVKIETIGPGTIGNMYGLSLTHDSTNYNLDPNAGTQQALNPFCSDWVVTGVLVNDVNWEGLDCHGGYDIHFTHNKVFNTKLGISCPSSSGGAANYAGNRNVITHNLVDGRKKDGTVSGRENLAYAINLNGGSIGLHGEVLCAYNIIVAKGLPSSSAGGCIQAEYTKGAQIHANELKLWGGIGVFLGAFSEDANVALNEFKELANPADTVAICVRHTGLAFKVTLTGNVATANSGTAARVGFDGVNLTKRPTLNGNDFKVCTVSTHNLPATGFLNGNDLPVILRPAAADLTPSLAELIPGNHAAIIMNPTGGSVVLTDFTNATEGQRITVANTHATNTVTFDRTANFRTNASTNKVLDRFDTASFVRVGTVWYECGGVNANG